MSAHISEKPTEAGIYDYLLGGSHYTEADRVAAEQALAVVPESHDLTRHNRLFLTRAVRYLAQLGIRQYIDLGSGYPVGSQVHEVAGEIIHEPHVIYVDYDSRVVDKSRELLSGLPNVVPIVGDIRRPDEIIEAPEVVRLIDWSQPVAVIFLAILHFAQDADQPQKLVAAFRDRMCSGSYIVISHATGGENPNASNQAKDAWKQSRSQLALRSANAIAEYFAGCELADPGLVTTVEWGTDDPPPSGQAAFLCGVARVP